MPLFFVLSGTIVTDKKLSLSAGVFFKHTVTARLPPYIFFSVLMAIVSLFISGGIPLESWQTLKLTYNSAFFRTGSI